MLTSCYVKHRADRELNKEGIDASELLHGEYTRVQTTVNMIRQSRIIFVSMFDRKAPTFFVTFALRHIFDETEGTVTVLTCPHSLSLMDNISCLHDYVNPKDLSSN